MTYKKNELMIAFITHLRAFESVGTPLSNSIQIFLDQIPTSRFKKTLTSVLRNIHEGRFFATSLKAHPKTFTPFIISLMEMAENTNTLGNALDQIKEHLLWTSTQKKLGISRLRYPALLGLLLMVLMVVLAIYLVPQITKFTSEMGGEISPTLLFLIRTGGFMERHWIFLGSSFLPVSIGISAVYRLNQSFQKTIARYFYQIPFMGKLLLEMDLAILSHILKITLSAHLNLLEALKIAEHNLKNPALKDTLHQIQLNIMRGYPLGQAFSNCTILPKYFQHFLEIGFSSNRLIEVLGHLNTHYTESYKTRMGKILETLPMVLLLMMGGILTGVILVLFAPLYDTFSRLDI